MSQSPYEPESFQRLARETAASLGLGDGYEPGPLAHFGSALAQADRFIQELPDGPERRFHFTAHSIANVPATRKVAPQPLSNPLSNWSPLPCVIY